MLQFEPNWRFNSPGPVSRPVVNACYEFIEKIARQGDAWAIVERFKIIFGGASRSSSESWAWADLGDVMYSASENAPVFIESFWKGCRENNDAGLGVPDLNLINTMLAERKAGYEIKPPYLVATSDHIPVAVPNAVPSLDRQARILISESIGSAERLLIDGKSRQAVSELLWLLETISTAFRGLGEGDETIQGKYFNAIVKEIKVSNRGKAHEQIFSWMTTLHGYLSSPTGGGVRHGVDLRVGLAIKPHEGRLYCNLIRSYITFMIEEHEQRTIDAAS